VATQGRPCRLVGQAVDHTVGVLVEVGNNLWPRKVFGGEVEGVEVAGGSGAKPDSGVVLLALQGAGRSRTAVSAKDVFQQLGRGPRPHPMSTAREPRPSPISLRSWRPLGSHTRDWSLSRSSSETWPANRYSDELMASPLTRPLQGSIPDSPDL
jgi:hypothetical protein